MWLCYSSLLRYEPNERLTAGDCLKHPFIVCFLSKPSNQQYIQSTHFTELKFNHIQERDFEFENKKLSLVDLKFEIKKEGSYSFDLIDLNLHRFISI